VQIHTHDTVKRALSGGAAPIERSPVTIGDSTYLGAQAVVDRGVTVGDHVVIGANAFVNRDIPPYTIGVGTPCRVIGAVRIDPDGEIQLDYDGGAG
jgi:acetyltransferase-like isoleucine patch superfamily enzyme